MPEWAKHLTEDDEWVVRTALPTAASALERAIALNNRPDAQVGPTMHAENALMESAARYRETLGRIELAD